MKTEEKNICKKCEKETMVVERVALRQGPNIYKLFDRWVCRECKSLKVEEMGEFDKNTDGTKRLLMDLKMGRVAKDHKRNIKSPVKEQEIDVMSLFPDEKKP